MLSWLLLLIPFLFILGLGAISSHAVFSWQDINNDVGKNANYCGTVTTLAALAGLITALKAACNAALTRSSITIFQAESDTATNADYENTTDKAVFELRCADTGEYVRISVPSPIKALFKENQKDIDPVATESAALITAIKAVLTSNSGAAITDFVKGWREKK